MTRQLSNLLDQLQQQMERDQLWQSVPPSADKLQSNLPFSVDTLTFLEWLQWIYVARLRAIIDARGALPKGAKVFPYAEEALKAQGDAVKPLLKLVYLLDCALV